MRPCARVALALLGSIVVSTGCGGDADEARSTPRRGGTAVVAGSHDLQHMNGLVADEQDTADLLKHGLFMTLVRFDSGFRYQPYLAESWSEEGDTAVVVRLRRDVAWHDGRPTTARDVVFTFQRVKDPTTGSGLIDLFSHWDAVEAVDSYTVRFRVRRQPDLLYPWTELPIAPAHLLDTVPAEAMRQTAFNLRPVGNGPFRFVSHRENDRWVFEANPAFPEELGGPPLLDRLIWRTIPESAAQLAELRTGNAHLAMAPRAAQLPELRAAPGIRVIHAPSNAYAFIGWNSARPPLDQPSVRRALTLAIDRPAIVQGLRGGLGTVATGPVPPAHWAHHPDLEPLPYDPPAARSLLEEAGWRDRDGDGVREGPDGSPLRIVLSIPAGVDYSHDLAEVVQSDLAEVGVELVIRQLEAATLFDAITARDKQFDGVLLTLAADFRLDLRDTYHSDAIGGPYQLSSWSSPDADSLMDAISAAGSREDAEPAWHRLQEVLQEEQPWTFLYYAPTIRAADRQLQGLVVDARGTFVTLPEWWLSASSGTGAGATSRDSAPRDAG